MPVPAVGKVLPCSPLSPGGLTDCLIDFRGWGRGGETWAEAWVVAGASLGQLLGGLRDGDGMWCLILAGKGFVPPQ